ncbi:MAG: hypothetical protein KBF92_00950 [Bacteroidia bacterium]|jgi:ABC-type uncharacterized transport system substrate-binding protein|nr:hypothetical protein [Saprospiraceae bacterium]MBP9922368.1 hypothetical protein [Bacteroidia bacterium]
MKNKLAFILILLCTASIAGISQETKIYPEKTVYYKTGINNELVYVNEENYQKELTFFIHSETHISLNFYIGEYRYTYFFDYHYSDDNGADGEIQYWKSEANEALLILDPNKISLYSFKDNWAIVYHIKD